MGSLKAALKAFFPNNNGDTNFSSSCLVPYFDSSQNPKGCVTPSKLASVLGGQLYRRTWRVPADNVEHTIVTGYLGFFVVKVVNKAWCTLFRKAYGTINKVEGTDLDSSHITVTATTNQAGLIIKADSSNDNIEIIEVG